MLMRRILVPLNLGVGATRHLIWYLSYQITGRGAHRERDRQPRLIALGPHGAPGAHRLSSIVRPSGGR